jgi:hypothetical protein
MPLQIWALKAAREQAPKGSSRQSTDRHPPRHGRQAPLPDTASPGGRASAWRSSGASCGGWALAAGHQDAQILTEGLSRLLQCPAADRRYAATVPVEAQHAAQGPESPRVQLPAEHLAGPNSSTMAMVTAPANEVIRLKSQGGTFLVCSGNWARRRFLEAI